MAYGPGMDCYLANCFDGIMIAMVTEGKGYWDVKRNESETIEERGERMGQLY